MLEAGVDLIETSRIRMAVTRYGSRFLTRVYTESEIAYCRGRPLELAARFAAKEAVSKALGIGLLHPEGVCWRDIEVNSDERGKPSLHLAGKAARRAKEMGLTTFALSLSHTQEHAVAVVVAQ